VNVNIIEFEFDTSDHIRKLSWENRAEFFCDTVVCFQLDLDVVVVSRTTSLTVLIVEARITRSTLHKVTPKALLDFDMTLGTLYKRLDESNRRHNIWVTRVILVEWFFAFVTKTATTLCTLEAVVKKPVTKRVKTLLCENRDLAFDVFLRNFLEP
jgi:hypothetical protein